MNKYIQEAESLCYYVLTLITQGVMSHIRLVYWTTFMHNQIKIYKGNYVHKYSKYLMKHMDHSKTSPSF